MNSNQNYTYTSPYIYILAFVLAICMYTFPFVNIDGFVNGGATDLLFNYSDAKWGDAINSFGPLSFLATRLGWGISKWAFLLFDLFMIFNFFYVFKDFQKASRGKFLTAFILFGVMLLTQIAHFTDLSWVYFSVFLFWLFRTYLSPINFSLVMLCLFTFLLFFIKANLGLVALVILIVHAVLLYFVEKLDLKQTLIIIGGTIAAVVAGCFIMGVPIGAYIQNGATTLFEQWNGTAFLSDTVLAGQVSWIYTLIKYFLIIYTIYLVIKGKFVQLYYVAVSALYILLLKDAAYAADTQNAYIDFLCYAPLIMVFGNLVLHQGRNQKYLLSGALIITLMCLFLKVEHTKGIEVLSKNRFSSKKAYIHQFIKADKTDYEQFMQNSGE